MGWVGTTGRWVAGVALVALVAGGCATVRVSVSSTGAEANGASDEVFSVSDDGRYVLFGSEADNLVPGDTNGVLDVFRRDTKTGATTRVDVAPNGSQLPTGATDGAMTPDGRFVAFLTGDSLDPGDTDGVADVYVRDFVAGTTAWSSQVPTETFAGVVKGQNRSFGEGFALSDDGRYLSFVHQGLVFPPSTILFRRDRVAGTTTTLTDDQFAGWFHASGDALHYSVNAVCYGGECKDHTFLLDLAGSANGWPALPFVGCDLDYGTLSASGRYLGWKSSGEDPAPCLPRGTYLVDRVTGVVTAFTGAAKQAYAIVGVSRDGTSVTYLADGNVLPHGSSQIGDLFAHDVIHDTDARLSVTPEGKEPNHSVETAEISPNGSHVAFTTVAGDVVPDDLNFATDVFVRPVGVTPRP